MFGDNLKPEDAEKLGIREINAQEIRGAHFFHTAKRELFMTERISTLLAQYGIPCGNSPIGFWQYGENLNSHSVTQNK